MGQQSRISRDREQIGDCQGLAGRKETGTPQYEVSFWGDENIPDIDGSGWHRVLRNVLNAALKGLQW